MIMHAKGSNMILGEARIAPTDSQASGSDFVPVFSCVYYLVPPPPSPMSPGIIELAGILCFGL
jgi:hypothetical protein